MSVIQYVAIIGAGAAGAITAAALKAEGCFDRIRIFERRESAGGTWIHDAEPPTFPIHPGKLPTDIDPPLSLPSYFPSTTAPSSRERWAKTPIYENLTTNVPSIAMAFSDIPFAYGPFVPHNVPKQYVEGYFSAHKLDGSANLCLNTTVEDVSRIAGEKWKLTLRRCEPAMKVDVWWEETFDAVVLANGHYAVPFVPKVKGLEDYLKAFPGRVIHSKVYRTPELWRGKKVLVIGNSASGHDIAVELVKSVQLPLYQSRRSKGRLDGNEPPEGFEWKPVIREFLPSGRIIFEDETYLDDIDTIIYCTGYLPSFPFWNAKNNGRELWDYEKNKLRKTYIHTFFHDIPSLAIVGIPRVLTFRAFEYQAVAIARLWAGRSEKGLPTQEEMTRWETHRKSLGLKKFHDVPWETGGGETVKFFEQLASIAGLGRLTLESRRPPVLGERVRWEIENVRKYPVPDEGSHLKVDDRESEGDQWVFVEREGPRGFLDFV